MNRLAAAAVCTGGLLACSPPARAIIYHDRFDRTPAALRNSPHWGVAHGAYYGYRIIDGRLVSVYYPQMGPEGLSADRYARVTHQGETYQRASIDIKFPEVGAGGRAPGFFLNLNWQGGEVFGPAYRLGVRGIDSFCVARLSDTGTEAVTSGWKSYERGRLSTDTWYRIEIRRDGNAVSGTITARDGTLLGAADIMDEGEPLNGGSVVLTAIGGGVRARSIELDNFQYELSNRETIQAVAVGPQDRPVIDGELTDPCWERAEAVGKFREYGGAGSTGRLATARIAFDDDNLYVAFRCTAEDVGEAHPLASGERSGGSAAQVFLDPFLDHRRDAGLDADLGKLFHNYAGPRLFRFAVNAANDRSSEVMGLPWYQVPWKSATYPGPDSWSAELEIPMASLAFFEPGREELVSPGWGKRWGVNFVIGDACWTPRLNQRGWPIGFGEVAGIHADATPRRLASLVGIGPRTVSRVPLVFTLDNATDRARTIRVTARVTPCRRGKPAGPSVDVEPVALEVRKSGWQHGSFQIPVPSPGAYVVLLSGADVETGKTLFHHPVLLDSVRIGRGVWDRSFYMNEPEAVLTLHCRPGAGGEARCDLAPEGGSPPASKTVPLNAEGTGRVRFDLRSLPAGDYPVTVTLTGHENHPFVEFLRKRPKRPGAVQYTERGVLLRDGKPFFPFGMYYVQNYLKGLFLTEYAAAGFNTFTMEWSPAAGYVRMAREMKAHGVFPIAGIMNMVEERESCRQETDYSRRTMLHGRFPVARQAVRMIAEQAGDGILAWYTRDEPNELMYDLVKGLHEIVREEDGYHPSMTVIYTPHLFPAYQDATDILGPDIYPSFPDGRISVTGEGVAKAVREMRGKPVLAVLQSFFPREGPYRMPNAVELRCMSYLSIVRGATGILWFSYDFNGPMAEEHPAEWKALKQLAREIRDLAPVILSDPPAGVRLMKQGADSVRARVYRHDGSHYVIAANDVAAGRPSVRFSLAGARARGDVEVLYENRRCEAEGLSWSDDFAPYAVHIYRLSG